MAVTPVGGNTSMVATGLQAVQAVIGPVVTSGFIVNPISSTDQGISGDPEPLYVDVVGTCAPVGGTLKAGGTIVRLEPGQNFPLVAGQTTSAWINAATSGHKFTVVQW